MRCLELVPQRELHAASRLRVAGGERAVVAAEAGEVRRVRQLLPTSNFAALVTLNTSQRKRSR